jgi:hypothetical protein
MPQAIGRMPGKEPMKLKLDDQGHVVVQDGRPVYVHDDGKEVAFDAPSTVATITRLNGEAKGHRERAEAAEGRLKAFEGIADGEAARKALELAKNIKDGELIAAGKVEEIKAAAKRAAEDQVAAAAKANAEALKALQSQNETLLGELYQEKIGGSFSRSKFIGEKIAIPPDMVEARFGKAFKVEDGKVVAYDSAGNKIFSRARPGHLADFDEALEALVEHYPYRDQILKASGASGAGSRESNGSGGGKTMTRAEYEANPQAGAGKLAQGYRMVD